MPFGIQKLFSPYDSKDILNEMLLQALPMEFAVEAPKLIALSLEGSVG